MSQFVEVLRCPATGEGLAWNASGALVTASGKTYPVENGVACLLPNLDLDRASDHASIREFYQNEGWREDEEGHFSDTKAFVDTRAAPFRYTQRCIARLARHFRQGGRYILDAGSGPITHDALLAYSEKFEKRVCVDLSAEALRRAREKLGERGVYLQGDLTQLPLQDQSMDAITCNHVLYQLPDDMQIKAMREFWRVLKPGGVAVVVYWWWPYAALAWRIERLAKALGWGKEQSAGARDDAAPDLFHRPHERVWFEAQDWPFPYSYDCFRVVDNPFMRRYVPDGWRGAIFLQALFLLQIIAPRFCGKHGAIPAIIIRKPLEHAPG